MQTSWFKFQPASSNDVGCSEGTCTHTNIHSHSITFLPKKITTNFFLGTWKRKTLTDFGLACRILQRMSILQHHYISICQECLCLSKTEKDSRVKMQRCISPFVHQNTEVYKTLILTLTFFDLQTLTYTRKAFHKQTWHSLKKK